MRGTGGATSQGVTKRRRSRHGRPASQPTVQATGRSASEFIKADFLMNCCSDYIHLRLTQRHSVSVLVRSRGNRVSNNLLSFRRGTPVLVPDDSLKLLRNTPACASLRRFREANFEAKNAQRSSLKELSIHTISTMAKHKQRSVCVLA